MLAVASMATTLITFFFAYRADWQDELTRMKTQFVEVAHVLQDDLEDGYEMVGNMQAYFGAVGGAYDAKEFAALAQRQLTQDNGLKAVYWLTPGGVVTQTVPAAPEIAQTGDRFASDPAVRDAMERARDVGTILAVKTSPVPGAPSNSIALLWVAPVYTSSIPASAEMRRTRLAGYILGLVRLDKLIDLRSSQAADAGTDEYFFGGHQADPAALLYVYPSSSRSGNSRPPPFEASGKAPHWTKDLSVANVSITAVAVASPDLHPFSPQPEDVVALVVGIVLTGFLAQYLVLNLRRSRDLQHRDEILHAISNSVASLQMAHSFTDGMTAALRTTGEAMHVDRVIVLENLYPDRPVPTLSLCYAWQAPDIGFVIDASFVNESRSADLSEWYAPLSENKPVIDSVRTATGSAAQLLTAAKIKSILLVPIQIDGKLWGNIGMDSCKAERRWAASEIDALRTLADVIGSSIVRQRFMMQLADVNKIVASSPHVLYRLKGQEDFPLTFVAGNAAWFGYTAAELLADPSLHLKIVHPEDLPKVRSVMDGALTGKPAAGAIEYRLRKKDGAYCWVESRFRPLLDGNGHLAEVEGILTDISERKAAEQQIIGMAHNDALTGLVNRRVFIEAVQLAIARTRRGGKRFAVHYLDLDHFKDVNDTLGHPAGDALLKVTAERLSKGIREVDIVSRFGGDEFAVLQTDLSDPADAGTLATKLLALVGESVTIDGNHIQIGTSIGIAVFEGTETEAESMMSHADVALYRAKAEGRGTFKFFTESMDADVHKRVKLASDLREALAGEQLFLVYQPQIDIASKRIIGVEALVRWRHPTQGLLPPPDFIDAAEKSGLVSTLGNWVLRQACIQSRRWIDAGIAPPTMAVNFSPLQFKVPAELEKNITAVLEEAGVPPHFIEIELTETALMETSREHNDVLQRLRSRGVKLAIDDFGTGYSSLSYLRRFPVDLIKLAQDFVKDVTRDPNDAAIVKAAIGLARDLNLDVIAEGVETPEQVALLRSWGCDAAQGYFFAKPLLPEELEPLLRRGTIAPATLIAG